MTKVIPLKRRGIGSPSRCGLMWVAVLAMLAVAQTASADMLSVASSPLSDFVIFSNGGVTYDAWDNHETWIGGHTDITGNIGSNQDLFQQGNPEPGYPAQLTGSAYAGGYLALGQELTVGSSSQAVEVVVNGANSTGSPGRPEGWIKGDATIYGNLYTTGDVDLGQNTAIREVGGSDGNLEYTGNFSFNSGTSSASIVEGTVNGTSWDATQPAPSPLGSTKTFTLINMPAATDLSGFVTGGTDQGPGAVTPNTLATAYGTLQTTAQDQTISLESGTYYFEDIAALNGGLTLEIDLTSGNPVEIYVLGDATFAQNNTLKVKGAGTSDNFVPISDAPELAGLIYLETQGSFTMGGATDANHNIWGGTVYASSSVEGVADISIGQYMDWYGAAYAFDTFNTADHGTWNHVSLVPVPGAVLLGILGLGVAAVKLRKSV